MEEAKVLKIQYFYLIEIDKMAPDFRGDPASAHARGSRSREGAQRFDWSL